MLTAEDLEEITAKGWRRLLFLEVGSCLRIRGQRARLSAKGQETALDLIRLSLTLLFTEGNLA